MRKIIFLAVAFIFITFASSCVNDDDDQLNDTDGTEQAIGKEELQEGDI